MRTSDFDARVLEHHHRAKTANRRGWMFAAVDPAPVPGWRSRSVRPRVAWTTLRHRAGDALVALGERLRGTAGTVAVPADPTGAGAR
jgi:hypothetical protein